MFSAIKKLQIVVHITLVSLAIPATAQIFYGYLLDICAFSFFPSDELYTFAFDLPEGEPVSMNFDKVGYGTIFYVLNVGDLFLVALSFPVNILIANQMLKSKSIKYRTKGQEMLKSVYWEGPLGLIEESFLITCISALLGLWNYDKIDFMHWGELFSFVCSLVMTLFVCIWPFAAYYILLKNIQKISKKAPGTETYAHLWSELKIPRKNSNFYKFNTGKPAVFYQFFSLLRRLLLAISMVCLINKSLFAIFAINFTTLAAMIISS